jgi:hypothetical protein
MGAMRLFEAGKNGARRVQGCAFASGWISYESSTGARDFAERLEEILPLFNLTMDDVRWLDPA